MFNIAQKITLVNGGTRGSNMGLFQGSNSIVRITCNIVTNYLKSRKHHERPISYPEYLQGDGDYTVIITDNPAPKVRRITLNRPRNETLKPRYEESSTRTQTGDMDADVHVRGIIRGATPASLPDTIWWGQCWNGFTIFQPKERVNGRVTLQKAG